MHQGPGMKESMACLKKLEMSSMAKWYRNKVGLFFNKAGGRKDGGWWGGMRVETEKVSNSDSRGSGEDSELFPKCNEKELNEF